MNDTWESVFVHADKIVKSVSMAEVQEGPSLLLRVSQNDDIWAQLSHGLHVLQLHLLASCHIPSC